MAIVSTADVLSLLYVPSDDMLYSSTLGRLSAAGRSSTHAPLWRNADRAAELRQVGEQMAQQSNAGGRWLARVRGRRASPRYAGVCWVFYVCWGCDIVVAAAAAVSVRAPCCRLSEELEYCLVLLITTAAASRLAVSCPRAWYCRRCSRSRSGLLVLEYIDHYCASHLIHPSRQLPLPPARPPPPREAGCLPLSCLFPAAQEP